MSDPLAGLDRVAALADSLAAAWSARAAASTTVGRERAVLRTFGVGGLDRDGRPLAWSVVDRWLAGDPARLSAGIALPFAIALLEYDIDPQALALEVAAGTIDLAQEAQLLEIPERRAAAELEARRLGHLARDRIDANHTARLELLALLGDAERPWLGATLVEERTGPAAAEAARLLRDGADLVRVNVPTGRELAMRLLDLGLDDEARGSESSDPGAEEDVAGAPTGSQRGLGSLRGVLDEIAAERSAYARLATTAPALSAPEQAVVAAFERIDLVEADPFVEIVEGGIDPDRALADHAFAHRIHRRGGALLAIGAGPLAVAPDLTRGVPSDVATRAGRALALQLLSVRLAVADGLDPGSVLLGAIPDWSLDEPAPAARALAEVSVRRALFPGHPLMFTAPASRDGGSSGASPLWSHLVAAALPLAMPVALAARPIGRSYADTRAEHVAARAVASAVRSGFDRGPLSGAVATHAAAVIAAAAATLEQLGEHGWRAVLGEPLAPTRPSGLGADGVTERTDAFDPFAD